MSLYSILLFQIFYLLQDRFLIDRSIALSSNEQYIFRSMFHLDELHHLCLVSVIFHYQGTYRIGDHHRLTFQEDAVTCDRINDFRLLHLLTYLLVTTRSADDQLSARLYTFNNSIVGGSVTCMKSDEDI